MSTVPRHILVVDDERNIRKLLAGVLEDEGFRVSTAGEGDAARSVLADDPVDLILEIFFYQQWNDVYRKSCSELAQPVAGFFADQWMQYFFQ